MSTFRPGWYQVRIDRNGRQDCKLFNTRSTIVATCYIEPNGRQILLWQAADASQARRETWQSSYKPLANAPAGDWWDNARNNAETSAQAPSDHSRAARQPTGRELVTRSSSGSGSALACEKEIKVGLFFDGTNNNMVRDKPSKGHSNIVTLYEAHKDDKDQYFRYYIPGVGTRFPEIGEMGEDSAGKTFGAGGEARIHYAMLQVFNAVSRSVTGANLFTLDEMKTLSTSVVGGLQTLWRLGDAKTVEMFEGFDARLKRAIEGKRPRVCKVKLSVFGFSRGAAEARVCVNWLQRACRGAVGGAALDIEFLGIFDTVASVALADSSPVGGSGFMDWADGNMEFSGVKRAVHYVAAHEIRRSFPLSTARSGGTWPSGTKEFAYPGAHSNLGGGYSPGDQGKSRAGRSALLSQISLNDMYFEALNAGVALFTKAEMEGETRTDFDVHPELDQLFSEYAKWTDGVAEKSDLVSSGGSPKGSLEYQTQRYWRWRASIDSDVKFLALESMTNASAQDKIDLWEAEQDWRTDVANAWAAWNRPVPRRRGGGALNAASDLQRALISQLQLAQTVTAPVSQFFDRYVHDSHAGFWMLGPITEFDRKEFIQEIKDKQKTYNQLMAQAAAAPDPESHFVLTAAANQYALNRFELRVLATDAVSPGSIPLMTDADAADLRDNAGLATSATLWAMGTATRREASGHARYRRIFDRS